MLNLYNKNYLSNRPFLVITTSFFPGPKAKTAVKGWAEKSGWNVAEQVVVVDRVKNKHSTYGTLIIDILEDKVVKNGFRESSDLEAKEHYMNKYRNQVIQALEVWADNAAKRIAIEQFTSKEVNEVAPVAPDTPAA